MKYECRKVPTLFKKKLDEVVREVTNIAIQEAGLLKLPNNEEIGRNISYRIYHYVLGLWVGIKGESMQALDRVLKSENIYQPPIETIYLYSKVPIYEDNPLVYWNNDWVALNSIYELVAFRPASNEIEKLNKQIRYN